jgi:hypothetical protein
MPYYSPEGARHEESYLAGRGHHESDREFAERSNPMTPSNPSEPTVALSVSIPVKFGGYTGQRDAWETHTKQMSVTLEENGDIVKLKANNSDQDQIWLPLSGLLAAIDIRKDYDKR